MPLHRRAEIANNAKANLFISIHTNAVARKNSYVKGTETYTLGLHRTEENLEVAKKKTLLSLLKMTTNKDMQVLTPTLLKAISYLNSCKTKTCRKA